MQFHLITFLIYCFIISYVEICDTMVEVDVVAPAALRDQLLRRIGGVTRHAALVHERQVAALARRWPWGWTSERRS